MFIHWKRIYMLFYFVKNGIELFFGMLTFNDVSKVSICQ